MSATTAGSLNKRSLHGFKQGEEDRLLRYPEPEAITEEREAGNKNCESP